MNAVLVELGQPDDPMAVYSKILDYQEKKVLCNSESVGCQFLQESYLAGNKTYMSLPSGICAAFKDYVTDRIVVVCYNSNFERGPFKDLIAEEISRIRRQWPDTEIQSLLDVLYPEITWEYVLVLVDNKHWIAVKRVKVDGVDKFVCYDPADGTEMEGEKMEIALKKSGYTIDKVDGLYICIV